MWFVLIMYSVCGHMARLYNEQLQFLFLISITKTFVFFSFLKLLLQNKDCRYKNIKSLQNLMKTVFFKNLFITKHKINKILISEVK